MFDLNGDDEGFPSVIQIFYVVAYFVNGFKYKPLIHLRIITMAEKVGHICRCVTCNGKLLSSSVVDNWLMVDSF